MSNTEEFKAAEAKAEAEIAAAVQASNEAPSDELISGLGPSKGVIHFPLTADTECKPQYKYALLPDEKPLLLTYFALIGLGEVPKLMLAEAKMPYECVACIGGEDQAIALEWRARSPNGLLPTLSGAGIPRSSPISQSSAIVRFLAKKMGMDGKDDVESGLVDVLFETAKDLNGKKNEIVDANASKDYSVAKGPFATGKRLEKLLEKMESPKDESAALNYGQIQLFHVLEGVEARREGCVKENLGDVLETFRVDMRNRTGLKDYMNSAARFPWTHGELGGEGYVYCNGPLKRGDMK